MNSRDFAEIGLDLSNPKVWNHKIFDKVADKLEFKVDSYHSSTAGFEFDGSDIEIVVDYGYVEIMCSKNDGKGWCLSLTGDGIDRLY
jgi:hypothetical protein